MAFSQTAITPLSQLKPGAKIHVIGVCGVAMAQMAVSLANSGFLVSGSDKEYFEPMRSLLERSSVSCLQGYSDKHIESNFDLVVIGNSVSASNPEVLATDQLALPYTIFPQLLFETAISGRHSIVVSGTHGKSTSSGMLAYVLDQLGKEPSYFVGGRVGQLPQSFNVGSGTVSVVEGDEYDSAFFAKLPKFHFYKPDTLIITSIEFDHADIYPNLESIKSEFLKLIAAMPKEGTVIACIDDDGVRDVLMRSQGCSPQCITYGISSDAQVRINFISNDAGVLTANIRTPKGAEPLITLDIPGRYNLKNAVANVLALETAGVAIDQVVLQQLKSFKGVDRRQQIWKESPVTLIEDFAHHPTAVRETLGGIKEWLPGRRLIAVFEPRSNTSRKKLFQADYVSAFAEADLVVMKEVEMREIDAASDLFDVKEVCEQISKTSVAAISFPSIEQIEAWVVDEAQKNDVVVVMSNGSFGGLIVRLANNMALGKDR